MDSIFVWLVGGVTGLLLTAAAVAVWEHLRRSVRPEDEFTSRAPKAVKVDLRLDRLPAHAGATVPLVGPAMVPAMAPEMAPIVVPGAPQTASPAGPEAATGTPSGPVSEMAQRRAALDEVLARLAKPAGISEYSAGTDDSLHDSPRFWAETTPMVAPGQLEPQEPAPIRRPGQLSAPRQS